MENFPTGPAHSIQDEALSLLSQVPGAIGNFVSIYPGIQTADEINWLETWFNEQINKYFSETTSSLDKIQAPATPPAPAQGELLAHPIRLISIQPHYFRGFRDTPPPIRLD